MPSVLGPHQIQKISGYAFDWVGLPIIGGRCVHTWTEFIETRPRFNGVPDTRLTSVLRRNADASAAMHPVVARDAARAPVRPITEL